MRAVIQRAARAEVAVNGVTIGKIGRGLVILLGVGREDTEADADYLAEKAAGLRIFPDAEEKMNLSVLDISGGALVVSQFTLYGDVRKGKRPSFIDAAPPEQAKALYERFVARLKTLGVRDVATGEFQAMMDVSLVNAGPVTILVDSRKGF
jgi:D-tyrosyl-tRNA(Tyr) deacylase